MVDNIGSPRTKTSARPSRSRIMAGSLTIAQRLLDQLGPDLYSACTQNDVGRVENLTSNMQSPNWSAAVVTAASNQAADVVAFCLRGEGQFSGTKDDTLWWVLADESLDPAYHFLVDSNFLDVNHGIDRTGTILGVLAGDSGKRHSLMEYILRKGARSDLRSDIEGGMYPLTAAAGHSDLKMVGLLLNYGAKIEGSGALILAAQCGKEDNVQCLLSRGADLNEMVPLSGRYQDSKNASSALHKAVQNGHAGVVDLLLKAGADLSLKDGKGRTAADIASGTGADADMVAKLS